VAAELGHVHGMISLAEFFDKVDPQRFVWLGRAAANGESLLFLSKMRNQVRDFTRGIRNASVVFVIGRALKGHFNNEKGKFFGRNVQNFNICIGPANEALRFYNFQLQSYRNAVDSWTIVGLRNGVVKEIRKMIGKIIWDTRGKAGYLENK
jgi:hypothetical protein